MSFFFFGWFSRKMDQNRKIWANAGVLRSGEETPRNGEGSPHSQRGREERLARSRVRQLRRSEATVQSMKNVAFWFCFVISLL